MSKVIVGLSTSVDGVAGAGEGQDAMQVHEAVLGWVFNLQSWQAEQGMGGGEDTAESKLWSRQFDRIGAQVVGRRMFDYSEPYWGENPPFHAPVFVVTHRAHERIDRRGGTSYNFVTGGITAALDQARAAAGGKDVLIAGGVSLAQQALAHGLVDELDLHLTPVLLGSGLRLLDGLPASARLTLVDSVVGEGAVHLTYRVER